MIHFVIGLCLLSVNGCGSSKAVPAPPPVGGLWTPVAGDLRFQGLGAFKSSSIYEDTNINGGGPSGAGASRSFQGYSGTPFEIGEGVCNEKGGGCSWFFSIHGPGSLTTTPIYSVADYKAWPASIESAFAAGHVITALDIETSYALYAIGEITPDSKRGGYVGSLSAAPAAQLQSVVQQITNTGQVVTAIAATDASNFSFASFSWAGDTSSKYEATATVCELDKLQMCAQQIASAGYIITAIGGNRASGIALVGTRLVGQAIARPLLIFDRSHSLGYDPFQQGYVTVGYILNLNPSTDIYQILEK